MKTDDLIAALAADTLPQRSVPMQLARGLPLGLAISISALGLIWGTRADLGAALTSVVVLKTLVPLLLAALACGLAVALARPVGRPGARVAALGLVLAAALAVFVPALGEAGVAAMIDRLVKPSLAVCLLSIPVLALPILAVVLRAMASGAPLRLRGAGAAAGLVAGGLSAAIYSFYCDQDAVLFVLPAYGAAIGSVCLVGALAGPRLLRW